MPGRLDPAELGKKINYYSQELRILSQGDCWKLQGLAEDSAWLSAAVWKVDHHWQFNTSLVRLPRLRRKGDCSASKHKESVL